MSVALDKTLDKTLDGLFDRVANRALRYRNAEIERIEPFEDGIGTFHFRHGFEREKFFSVEMLSSTEDHTQVELAVRAQGQHLTLAFETARDAFVRGDQDSTNCKSMQKLMTMLLSLR